MLSSRWYDPAADPRVPRSWFGRGLGKVNDQLDRLQGILAGVLGWSLSHRWAVLVLATAAIVGSFSLFGKLGSAFMPNADPGQFQVSYKAAPGISLDRSMEIARELEREIRRNPAVTYTYATIGGTAGKPTNEGNIYIRLNPRKTRKHYSILKTEVRQAMARFRAVRTSIEEAGQVGGDIKPIQISVRGSDLSALVPLSDRLMAQMRQVAGASDVDSSEDPPQTEVRIAVNRNAASDLGLDLGTVASTMRGLVAGDVVSQFEDPDGDSYDVRLRVQRADRTRAIDLLGLDLPAQGGRALVPASQLVSLETGTAPSKVRRRDLMREIRVSASTEGRSLGEVIADIKSRAATLKVPTGYRIDYTGESEDMMESFGYASQSLLLAVILIYAVLASQFRSFLQPFAIMLSLPLSLVGVAGMLYLVHDTLNIMSMIGVILLMGLVTKNAILVVDFANVQRRQGCARREALIIAARVRLRPILMTTLAMIFGMLPLAFEIGSGAEFRAPMARAVIGGLITSTLLTLIVVPVVYTYLDDLGGSFERWWSRKTPDHAKEDAAVASRG
jgi:HAE1 family hydrophobic/amphiphilic exporter-1